MKMIEKMLSKVALATAKKSAGNASVWLVYQPKEPASLKKISKK